MVEESIDKIDILHHIPSDIQDQKCQHQRITNYDPDPSGFIIICPDEMIISNYDPGNSRDDQPIPENQVLG